MSDCSPSCAVSSLQGKTRLIRSLQALALSMICATLAISAFAQTGYITTVAGMPAFPGGGYTGDGGQARNATFRAPWGVSTDINGNFYISDTFNHVVRKVDVKTGIVSTIAGNGYGAGSNGGYTGDGGLATSAELNGPAGTAFDRAGNLYIADQYNHAIRRVDARTQVITTIAGDGARGYKGDNGPAVDAQVDSPAGLAFDNAGNLFIADQNNNAIRRIDAKTGIITTVAGNGHPGSSGDGGPATGATLFVPFGLAIDRAGNLYFGGYDCRIRKVTAATGVISGIAGTAFQCGFSGDDGPAAKALLDNAVGIAIDGAGNIFFSDHANSEVRKVNVTTGIISRVAGTGTFGYSGDGGPAKNANISLPTGLSLDDTGNLYFSDSMYNAIRKIQSAGATRPPPTPVFNPKPGNFTQPFAVTITDFNRLAVIHYTLDGTTPTASSATYTAPIQVTSTVTIKAIAVISGRPVSSVASGTYTMLVPAATPLISPPEGEYGIAQLVKLTDATPGATIYYTTNNANPTTGSTKYTAPFTLTGTTMVKAFATAPVHLGSLTATAVYSIHPAPSLLTSPATAIGTSQATLHVVTSRYGAEATVWFVYGTSSTAMTSSTPKGTMAPATPTQEFTTILTGLKSKTTYYFQPKATGIGGTASGAIASFTTN